MPTQEELCERIHSERAAQQPWTTDQLAKAIRTGNGQAARDNLLFFTPPAAFPLALDALRQALAANFGAEEQEHALRFLADMAISLYSFLPAWNLRAGLSEEQILAEARATEVLAARLAAAAVPSVIRALLADWLAYTKARLEVEKAADPVGAAQALVGGSVAHYVAGMAQAVSGGYLRRIAEARYQGATITELGNDYAAFLDYAMYLGASFATTNPPLILLACQGDPERWNPVVQQIVAANPQDSAADLARRMTLQVVLANMQLLRPIFLLTEGRMGLVSLQINPKKHDDAAAMLADATTIYTELAEKQGGVPNVVFKLPATRAGLEAGSHLAEQGIGTNATVNFGLFQEIPFAEAGAAGEALATYLTEMNGRLAFPVRDELVARATALGISEAEAREAAAWSGVAVHKKLLRILQERGYDLSRLRPLIASLRWYEGPGYEKLPDPCPDVVDCLGTTVITIFPNIRHALDKSPSLPLDGNALEAPVPEKALEILSHSEIFKQSYYLPGDDERFRPERVLTLDDEAGTAAWVPVAATLAEFCQAYDRFVDLIASARS